MSHETFQTKKSLGQHFLHDQHVIRRIVEAVPAQSTVIEIGPGRGALTHQMLKRQQKLTLIEKDHRLVEYWQEEAKQHPLSVQSGDVMDLFETVFDTVQPEWVVGNLPYNISGPLTALLCSRISSGGMVLMYQKEVADRIAAESGSKTCGSLSILARHHYNIKRLIRVSPGAFSPPPRVHSAVLLLTPHHKEPKCSYQRLQKTVRHGFAHRRKTLRNNFRDLINLEQWDEIQINPTKRPEQLNYDAWVQICIWLEGR
ncbi:MAG: 16S rRNA (adenine(1518)-N(6)/adenine(1519)-N(6))-dimethyltransferase RsmA [Mariprofundaceae bacterium]|nr:16S rRNA (adenine(1518)-N(6)/adenine(1519)-N(6))-dimethyltransferase RsmA [Mariprofundaceae bacterium]